MRWRTPEDRVRRRRLRWWQHRSSGTWWTVGVMAVLGVGMLTAVVRMEREYLALDRHGVHATATIEQVRPEKRSTDYLVRFAPGPRTPADTWTTNVSGAVGDTVDVVYDPADPASAISPEGLGTAELLVPGLLGVGGLACLAVMCAAVHDRSDQGPRPRA